jgi:hypothetical protein
MLGVCEGEEVGTYECESCLFDSWSVTSVDVEIRSTKVHASVLYLFVFASKERHTIDRWW